MHLNTCIAVCLAMAFVIQSAPGAFPSATQSADAACPRAGDGWWGSGWMRRAPVTIDCRNGTVALSNYQVPVNISYASSMKSDFSDIRFVQNISGVPRELPFWIEGRQDGLKARAWVNVSQLAAQASSVIYMYYGNPSAVNSSDGNTTFDFFDDFNGPALDSAKWNPVHLQNSSISGGVLGGMLDFGAIAQTQHTGACVISKMQLPNANYIAETKLKFTNYYQSAFGAYAGFTNSIAYDDTAYGTPAKLVAAKLWDYTSKNMFLYVVGDNIPGALGNGTTGTTQITIRNLWFKIVTVYTPGTYVKGIWTQLEAPFAEQSLELKGAGGIDPTYVTCGVGEYNTNQHTTFDHVLIRKYSAPEPSVSIGPEERPYGFRSMSFIPGKVSEGDIVGISVLVDNPTGTVVSVPVSLRLGPDFASAEELQTEVLQLAPGTATRGIWNWTAVGGRSTVWCALDGIPVHSAVIDVNRDPVFAPVKDQNLMQDRDFLLQLNASDPDGDSLSWSMDNPLIYISQVSNHTAEITFRPTNDNVGVHRANITVTDPMNRSVTRRVNFTVINVNDPPALEKIPALAATQYKELRYKASASDPDIKWGDVLTFSDNTDIFDIDARTGEFSFIPLEEQVGKHTVKITVTDSAAASATCSFTITVANVNDPPALEMLPAQSALQGRQFQLKVAAADPDLKSDPTEKLRFSDDCPLFNINNESGLISFTPTNDQIGVWNTNITVTDRGGLSNTTSLTITVLNANDPPSIEAIPAQTATEEQPFQCQANATDPDLKWGLDNVTFSDDTELFNIDPRTGAIAFTPTAAQVGMKRVTITVKDDKGASASASLDITVVHVNHPPFEVTVRYPADGAKLKEGEAMWLDGTARDPDKGDTLQYSWFDNDEAIGTGKNVSVKLSPGTHTIRLEVSDGTVAVSSTVSVQVQKKETVTVASSGSSMLPVAAAAAAVFAIVAVVAVLAMRRRRTTAGPEASAEARGSSVHEGEDVALAPVPPPEAGEDGEQARALIDSTVDRLAKHQEEHPEEALDVAPVMEKLDMARQMLRSGENDDALDFAKDAAAVVDMMLAPVATAKVAIKKKKVGRKAGQPVPMCQECGEELSPQWATCPACGRKT